MKQIKIINSLLLIKIKIRNLIIILSIFVVNASLACNYNKISNDAISSTVDSTNNISLSLGVTFSHFIPTNEAKDKYWDTPLLNMGGEALISYNFNENQSILTGFNYQYGKIALKDYYYGDRTMFHEITFPILGDFSVLNISKTKLFLRTGIYLGQYSKVKRETKGGKISPDTNKWYDYPINNGSPNFICDYYVSLRNKPINTKVPIYLELFFKYRINEHWLTDDISRFMYGIKLTYSIKF